MDVLAVPLDDFVHGHMRARRGHAVELAESLARDLERRGLVEIKARPLESEIAREPVQGKSQAVGAEQLSSASPAVPALPQTIANESVSGKRRGRPRKGT